MKIRKSTIKNAECLAWLDKTAHREKRWWKPQSKKYFEKLIRKKSCRIVIAENKGNILGYLQTKLRGKSLWIENVYVLDRYRNRNIAKKLFEFAMRDTRLKVAELITPDDNLIVFKKLGFRKTGVLMRFRK